MEFLGIQNETPKRYKMCDCTKKLSKQSAEHVYKGLLSKMETYIIPGD